MQIINVCGHSFLPACISPTSLILDCGSNRGEFSAWCSRNLPNQIYAFEPDPRLFSSLPQLPNVHYLEAAVTDKKGRIPIALGEQRCSSAVFKEAETQGTYEVESISLEEFFAQFEKNREVGLLKLDIEGSELPVLEGLTPQFLEHITQITVEFHDFLDQAQIPRIAAVVERLKNAGFTFVRFSHYTWGDCLFVRNSHCQISNLSLAKIYIIDKFAKGIARHLRSRVKHHFHRLT